MKKIILILLIASFLYILFSCSKNNKEDELVIYAYDSFLSEWGTGPKVFPIFEEKYNIKIKTISSGDSGQVLSRLIMEADKPVADIVIGIDNNMAAKAIRANILEEYRPQLLSDIRSDLIFDKKGFITPFDYGFFSIVYDSEKIKNPHSFFDDLLDSNYKKSIILIDPRTSGVGLGFLLWTVQHFGNNFASYWEKLSPNILTIADGWDSGYGLFVNGEAPIVISYTTSPPYHLEYEKTERYKAAIFDDGNYMYIEGAAIIKGTKKRKEAEKFIDFMLSDDFQKEIPKTNWMFPVKDIALPDSFKIAPKPDKYLMLDMYESENNVDSWIKSWLSAVNK